MNRPKFIFKCENVRETKKFYINNYINLKYFCRQKKMIVIILYKI